MELRIQSVAAATGNGTGVSGILWTAQGYGQTHSDTEARRRLTQATSAIGNEGIQQRDSHIHIYRQPE